MNQESVYSKPHTNIHRTMGENIGTTFPPLGRWTLQQCHDSSQQYVQFEEVQYEANIKNRICNKNVKDPSKDMEN